MGKDSKVVEKERYIAIEVDEETIEKASQVISNGIQVAHNVRVLFNNKRMIDLSNRQQKLAENAALATSVVQIISQVGKLFTGRKK